MKLIKIIKGLELIRDITHLFEKKIVIWGMEFKGKKHLKEILILATVDSIDAQEEILERICELYGDKIDVCTEYAVEWGIYFGLKCSKVEEKWREQEVKKRAIKIEHNKTSSIFHKKWGY